MASNQTYAIGDGWKAILAQVGVDNADVLRRAQLPEDRRTRCRSDDLAYGRLLRVILSHWSSRRGLF